MRNGIDYPGSTEDDRKINSAEVIAQMVFGFVAGAKAFTEGMDKSDEVKLLRLRTRKNEIVIVPGTSFTASLGHLAEKEGQIQNFYLLSYMMLRQLN